MTSHIFFLRKWDVGGVERKHPYGSREWKDLSDLELMETDRSRRRFLGRGPVCHCKVS